MKAMKVSMLALALFGVAGIAQADDVVYSGISNGTYVQVGGASSTTVDDHGGQAGDPAIGVNAFYGGARVSFAGLQGLGSTSGAGTASDPKLTHITPAMMPPSHAALGNFNFAQAGSQAVYFGEWSSTGSSSSSDHTVYYAGVAGNVATTLPATATYTVKSINNAYSASSGSALPTSTLSANFGSNTASSTGDISFTGGTISVSGARVALGASGVSVASVSGTGGTLSGDFFGTGAAAVAGIVTFASSHSKDTAFGGPKVGP
ncbi:MAG: Slam-dependent surface lipoprotein [Pseudoxanthomonas sp.]